LTGKKHSDQKNYEEAFTHEFVFWQVKETRTILQNIEALDFNPSQFENQLSAVFGIITLKSAFKSHAFSLKSAHTFGIIKN
jgi:hypothetical protein